MHSSRALSIYRFQILAWVIGYNLLGIPLYFFVYNMQECIDPTVNFGFWPGILTNIISGIITGTVMGTIDIVLERSIKKNLSFFSWFSIKSFLYLLFFIILALSTGVGIRFINTHDLSESLERTTSNSGLYIIIGYLIFSSFFAILVSFFGQIKNMTGKGLLLPIFLGRYFKPKEEERIFMFLDLKSSTTIAEKIGHLKYSQFIQDCFFDLDQTLNKHQAKIYQYVGDEAILTWNKNEGLKNSNCIHVYFHFMERLEKRNKHYQEKYGHVPFFKAGVHIGQSVVSEIGGQKKEIAYHGDVLNTTARIQGLCNDFQKYFLISKFLLNEINMDNTFSTTDMGNIILKGKQEEVGVFAIEKKEMGT